MKNKLITILGVVIASLLVGGYYANARISSAPSSGGVTSITAGTGLGGGVITSAGTIINLGVTSLVQGTDILLTNTTGTVTVANRTASSSYVKVANNLSDVTSSTARTNLGLNEFCDMSFGIEGATSTNALDLNGDSFVEPFPYNATITKVKVWNTQAGQSASFNLSYNADATAATSTFRVFTAHKTGVNNTTTTVYTPDASSTPAANDILRINFGNTSSTQFQVNVCYTPR